MKSFFPSLPHWLNDLPDPRKLDRCRYSGSHLWFSIISTYFYRGGSRNAFDEKRNFGELPANFGELCGQKAGDPRFDGKPMVTCSDNAALHAARVDCKAVAEIPIRMMKLLLNRRLFDKARLFKRHYVLIVDGTVQEKCREGFTSDGKSSSGQARYRYVVQVSILGPKGTLFPFMHESMDMHDPQTQKEDCELNAFLRLSQRIKALFPHLEICLVADALYGCQTVVKRCLEYGWKYVLTFKEKRQPTTWEEMIRLLPLNRSNVLRVNHGTTREDGRTDYRWIEEVILGEIQTNIILMGEITKESATLYAYMTNFSNFTPERIIEVASAGRQRHRIEDIFNIQKNHGIGLEHVFCADSTGAKNYYSMMQVALIYWQLYYHGHLKRVYKWAMLATEQGLARTVWEAFQYHKVPPDLPPIGQVRFGFP